MPGLTLAHQPFASRSWITATPEQTQSLGQVLGGLARIGEVFALYGDLGTGKTCLTQGLARGLGVAATVPSPTFVLIREYVGRVTLWHIDPYRLSSLQEAEDSGLTDYLPGDGVTVVEWAEKIAALLPQERWEVRLAFAAAGRRIEVRPPPDRWPELEARLPPPGPFGFFDRPGDK